MNMTWHSWSMVWAYKMRADGVDVPAYWTKTKGFVENVILPEVRAANVPQPGQNTPEPEPMLANGDLIAAEAVSTGTFDCCEQEPPDALPQGVSYDRSSGTYQSNIRGKSGKFIF